MSRKNMGLPDDIWAKLLLVLGKMPDTAVAKSLGVDTKWVRNARNLAGIPPFAPRPPRIRWTRSRIVMLGTATDQSLADKWGVCRTQVTVKRNQLGIASFGRPSKAGGRERNKDADVSFEEGAAGLLVRLGAKPNADLLPESYDLLLPTKYGRLLVRAVGQSVYAMFVDDKRGRWDHHFFGWPAKSALDELSCRLQSVLNTI
jgi:hypothetical protein